MILYTSGSTGKPKGVVHTHGSILDTAKGRAATQQLTADDVSLAATAICRGGGSIGVTFPTLFAGGTVVILEEIEPELFLEALAQHRPTRTLLLPAQLLDAVESPQAESADFSCLREVQCGGDQISPDLYTQFAKVEKLELNQAYGMTECEGCSMNPPFGTIKRGSIGQPREGIEIRLSGVVGSPDPRLGAIVHAFVQPVSGPASPASEQDRVAFAFERLAAYKVPDRWTFVKDLPRNDVGKIDRKALHARATELDTPATD